MSKKLDPTRLGLENYSHPDKFGEWLGYEVIHIDKKAHVAEVALKIREDHLSPAGRVHGGVISAFFDYACGAAVFSTLEPQDFCSTVELKVNYFRPIDMGDSLKAVTRVVFRGKKLCVLHGFIYRNDEKEPVAMATATFNIIHVK
jgi:acyl-CoA thioesterase